MRRKDRRFTHLCVLTPARLELSPLPELFDLVFGPFWIPPDVLHALLESLEVLGKLVEVVEDVRRVRRRVQARWVVRPPGGSSCSC